MVLVEKVDCVSLAMKRAEDSGSVFILDGFVYLVNVKIGGS